MSKVSFNKLKLTLNNITKTFNWNENIIEVKQYLPVNEKLDLIENTLKNSIDENGFINPAKQEIFFYLELVYHYTNVTFTETQKEKPDKLFDLLNYTKFIDKAVALIPEDEFHELFSFSERVGKYFEKSLTSLSSIFNNFNAKSAVQIPQIKEFLDSINKEDLDTVKQVVTKLG